MKTIIELESQVNEYHNLLNCRSHFLDVVNKLDMLDINVSYSIRYDGSLLCDLPKDKNSFFLSIIKNYFYGLVFKYDSYLNSFCSDNDISYLPISDHNYLYWLGNQYQSK